MSLPRRQRLSLALPLFDYAPPNTPLVLCRWWMAYRHLPSRKGYPPPHHQRRGVHRRHGALAPRRDGTPIGGEDQTPLNPKPRRVITATRQFAIWISPQWKIPVTKLATDPQPQRKKSRWCRKPQPHHVSKSPPKKVENIWRSELRQ